MRSWARTSGRPSVTQQSPGQFHKQRITLPINSHASHESKQYTSGELFLCAQGRNGTQVGLTFDEYNPNLTMDQHPQLAIFSFTPNVSLAVEMEICLEDDILVGATVSIYINQQFTW